MAGAEHTRTCIACGRHADKRSLVRIVRDPSGNVALDPTGRAAGRGAYVCSADCLRKAAKGRLAKALRTSIDEECINGMAAQMVGIPQEQ